MRGLITIDRWNQVNFIKYVCDNVFNTYRIQIIIMLVKGCQKCHMLKVFNSDSNPTCACYSNIEEWSVNLSLEKSPVRYCPQCKTYFAFEDDVSKSFRCEHPLDTVSILDVPKTMYVLSVEEVLEKCMKPFKAQVSFYNSHMDFRFSRNRLKLVDLERGLKMLHYVTDKIPESAEALYLKEHEDSVRTSAAKWDFVEKLWCQLDEHGEVDRLSVFLNTPKQSHQLSEFVEVPVRFS